MNHKIKAILIAAAALVMLTFAGCGGEETPYQINDAENYNVSVKYDANGGFFTTNTSVIVDSYNLAEIGTDKDGNARIALLSPDDSARGNDAFTAVNSGYFLAGWYTERLESTDAQGNTVYTYSGRWDFANDTLRIDPNGSYSAGEPVITLYAAWVPMFEIEFCDLGSGELLSTYTFDPTTEGDILVPQWDAETGAVEMYRFPKRAGYTFDGAYYDAQGTQAVNTAAVEHPGQVDYETGSADNTSMRLYVDWTEGEWFHIYTVEQFLSNASLSGNYEIYADLDFSDKIWPTVFMYGTFTGSIEGNGHCFSNISIAQTNNSKTSAGMFGTLSETSRLSNLTLENVTFTIQSGTRVVGTSYGLLAGSISSGAAFENVNILSGTLRIDSGAYFGVDDYVIGLVCGMGNPGIDYLQIECAAVGENPDSVKITVNENMVTVEFVTE